MDFNARTLRRRDAKKAKLHFLTLLIDLIV